MKIENLDKFRGKMKWTTVTKDGKVTISVGPKKYTGTIGHSPGSGYFVDINGYHNSEPFDLAGVEKVSFMESVLGYTDDDGKVPSAADRSRRGILLLPLSSESVPACLSHSRSRRFRGSLEVL